MDNMKKMSGRVTPTDMDTVHSMKNTSKDGTIQKSSSESNLRRKEEDDSESSLRKAEDRLKSLSKSEPSTHVMNQNAQLIEKEKAKVVVDATKEPGEVTDDSSTVSGSNNQGTGGTEDIRTSGEASVTQAEANDVLLIWNRCIKLLEGSKQRKKTNHKRGQEKERLLLDLQSKCNVLEKLPNLSENNQDKLFQGARREEMAAVAQRGPRKSVITTSTEHMDKPDQNQDVKLPAEESKGKEESGNTNEELMKKVKYLEEKVQTLKYTVQDYSNRLAAEMGKKLASDESSLENINIKSRPMNVGEEYSQIMTDEWLAAKTMLDERYKLSSEQEKVAFLCDVIEIAKNVAEQMHHDIMTHLSKQYDFLWDVAGFFYKNSTKEKDSKEPSPHEKIKRRVTDVEPQNRYLSKGGKRAKSMIVTSRTGQDIHDPPLALTNAVGDFLRTTVDTTDLRDFYQIVMDQILDTWGKGSKTPGADKLPSSKIEPLDFKGKGSFIKYVNSVSKLAWKMTIQRPQMTFDFTIEQKGDKYQDIYWCSKVDDGSQVTVVHPILYHGGHLMAKGKIYLWLPDIVISL